jgi:DNA-binding CsgD family transcriptional regulator
MTPLILRGRSREAELAKTALHEAGSTRRGTVMVITGEPGVGKSSLLAAISDGASDDGFAVGWSRATEVDDLAAGALVLLALRSGREPLLSTDAFRDLAAMYDKRLWLADRLAESLHEKADGRPIFIGLDDYQLADSLSRFLFRALTSRLRHSPVVWGVTWRGSRLKAAEAVRTITADDRVGVSHLSLEPLLDRDILALGADIVGQELSPSEAAQLRAASGNPLLASQLAEEIASRRNQPGQCSILTSLEESLITRTAQLGDAGEELLHLAAVWGQPLPLVDASEMAGLRSARPVIEQARSAAALGLVDIVGSRVEFRHDLIREFYYNALPRSAKVELHRRCAAFIMTKAGNAVRAAPHAQACAQLGDDCELPVLLAAAQECVLTLPHVAAELARAAFATVSTDAPDWFDTGEICAQVLASAQHGADALRIVDPLLEQVGGSAQRARLQIIAARALWSMGRLGEIIERVDSTLAQEGIPRNLTARLTAAKALALSRADSAAAASAAANKALELDGDDTEVVAVAVQALSQSALNAGYHQKSYDQFHLLRTRFGPQFLASEIKGLQNLDRYSEAQALLDEAFLSTDAHSDTVLPDLLSAQHRQEWHMGHLDSAAATARKVIRLSDELGIYSNRLEAWIVLGLHAVLHSEIERADEMLRLAERDVAIDKAACAPELLLLRGHICAARGDAGLAVELLEPMISDAAQRHHYWPRSQECPRLLAGIAMAAGRSAFAEQCVVEADRVAAANPAVATFRGIALLTRGYVEQNWRLLDKAASILADAPRVMLHALARADLGRTLVARGQPDRGARELARSLSIYEWLDLAQYVDEVRSSLDSTGQPSLRLRKSIHFTDGRETLTDAESAVAEQIARGASNRVAAQQLHVSIHTVKTHLRSIYAKLNVQSRVQLANAWNTGPVLLSNTGK